MSLPPGLERGKEREGNSRGSKSPRLTYTASIESHNEIRRLKDELVSERRSKDSLIDIERGRVDSMQKQIDSLKQHMSESDARLVEAEQRFKESQRRLAVAESMIENQKLEMEAAEARYQKEKRDVERERETYRQGTIIDRTMLESLSKAFDEQREKSLALMSQNIDSAMQLEGMKSLCEAARSSVMAYQEHAIKLQTEVARLESENKANRVEAAEFLEKIKIKESELLSQYRKGMENELMQAKAESERRMQAITSELEIEKRTCQNLRASLKNVDANMNGKDAETRKMIDDLRMQVSE
jgi:hypothetical protein